MTLETKPPFDRRAYQRAYTQTLEYRASERARRIAAVKISAQFPNLSPRALGDIGEERVAEWFRSLGRTVERQRLQSPFDLLIDGECRVEVKFARVFKTGYLQVGKKDPSKHDLFVLVHPTNGTFYFRPTTKVGAKLLLKLRSKYIKVSRRDRTRKKLLASPKFRVWGRVRHYNMSGSLVATEQHFSVPQVAAMWGISRDTVTKLFENEEGVLILGRSQGSRSRRKYRTLKIPMSVMVKVHRDWTNGGK